MPVAAATQKRLIVVMGPTGCGKSTIGRLLSQALKAEFIEGDEYHPAGNKAKMTAGYALTDEDRWPWLQLLSKAMDDSGGTVIASCSALKTAYRDFIQKNCKATVLFVELSGTKELLANRLSARTGHFMNQNLLDSQIATLEPLGYTENGFKVSIDAPVPSIVEQIRSRLEDLSPVG